VTAFFIPGMRDHASSALRAYGDMRKQAELFLGRPPRQRRIRELWARRGSLDCVTTVGEPDPVCGEIVMAIFDMGPHQPFVVCHGIGEEMLSIRCDVLGASAYTVSEFDL
jgi:hypothetical protein